MSDGTVCGGVVVDSGVIPNHSTLLDGKMWQCRCMACASLFGWCLVSPVSDRCEPGVFWLGLGDVCRG